MFALSAGTRIAHTVKHALGFVHSRWWLPQMPGSICPMISSSPICRVEAAGFKPAIRGLRVLHQLYVRVPLCTEALMITAAVLVYRCARFSYTTHTSSGVVGTPTMHLLFTTLRFDLTCPIACCKA